MKKVILITDRERDVQKNIYNKYLSPIDILRIVEKIREGYKLEIRVTDTKRRKWCEDIIDYVNKILK